MNARELPELLTIKEAAMLIRVHPNTLRNWEREGKIEAVRIGNRRDRRFTKDSLMMTIEGIIHPIQSVPVQSFGIEQSV